MNILMFAPKQFSHACTKLVAQNLHFSLYILIGYQINLWLHFTLLCHDIMFKANIEDFVPLCIHVCAYISPSLKSVMRYCTFFENLGVPALFQ